MAGGKCKAGRVQGQSANRLQRRPRRSKGRGYGSAWAARGALPALGTSEQILVRRFAFHTAIRASVLAWNVRISGPEEGASAGVCSWQAGPRQARPRGERAAQHERRHGPTCCVASAGKRGAPPPRAPTFGCISRLGWSLGKPV